MHKAVSRTRRPWPRAAGVLVMLALHAGLLVGVWGVSQWTPRRAQPAPAQAPLIVRLLWPRPATADRAEAASPRPPTSAARAAAAAAAPQAITLPPAPDGRAASTQPDVVSAPLASLSSPQTAASSGASAPLDLKLRGGPAATWHTPAQAAFNDPRANTPRATLESRIAAAAGPGAWVEERIDGTRVRFRRGSDCFELHRTRNAVLSPWNQAISPTPQMATPCN